MRIIAVALMLLLLTLTTVHAQEAETPPYLYYYSQLLGGLIIERADGTDSRQIAADMIPAGMSGLAGPGWSPSGKYFAAYRINYAAYKGSTGGAYLIDIHGSSILRWLEFIPAISFMEWSPTGEDLLLIVGRQRPETSGIGTFFWLIDVTNGDLLADFGANMELPGYDLSEITWDVPHEQIVFYISPNAYDHNSTYRVTMHFDGTTLREPVEVDAFHPMSETVGFQDFDFLYKGDATSPSGRYEIHDLFPSILTDTVTGELVELPMHTQGTICRAYDWSADEQYIITLSGTLVAGGGCAGAVMGITDLQGQLWREIGGCSWAYPPCVDWLPGAVDVAALPPGAPEPVQLDHTAIVYEEKPIYHLSGQTPSRLMCEEQSMASIVDPNTQKTLYRLNGVICPYSRSESTAEKGIEVMAAYDPVHDLLATYTGFREVGVTIWIKRSGRYVPVLKLNTAGYQLEFRDEGQALYARNPNGWKVYAVADILQASEANA